ncbi:MAG TPA: hypothetical protein VGH27_32320 [Streptosporangiaceae bacterium]|jgi:hypothetical protein
MRIRRLAVPACALLLAAGSLSAPALAGPTAFLPYGQGPATQLTAGPDRGLGQTKKFADGAATFTVPPGHYLVLCYFLSQSHHKITGTHVVVLPQVTVTGDTTTGASAVAADSRVQVVTPRPADLQRVSLDVYRWTAAHQLLDANAYSQYQGPIWINPTAKVTVGSLRTSVAAGLVSPPGTADPCLRQRGPFR